MTGSLAAKLGRFATVGVAATACYALLGWLFARILGASPLDAAIAAYAVSAGLSYAGHRWITFRSDRAHAIALAQFLALSAMGCSVAALLSWAGERAGLPVEAALLATCVLIPLLNYLALDRIVFRRSGASAPVPLGGTSDGA